MSIFKKGAPVTAAKIGQLYRIRITTESGQVLYWHKRGRLHLVEEDVARAFVGNFKPQLFQVNAAGSFEPPGPATMPVARVDMEPV